MSKLNTPIFNHTLLTGIFLLVFSLLVLFHSPAYASQKSKPKTVLILYSLGHVFPATVQWDRGIRSVLNGQEQIRIYTEHLDLSRYNDSDYIEMMVEIFHHKYSGLGPKPDLVITVFEPAFNFVLKHRQELFGEAPIVFGGVERLSLEEAKAESNITGVFQEESSFTKTLDLALDLHPDTSKVVVFGGAGFMEQSWLASAQKSFQRYADRLEIMYMTGLSLEEMISRSEKLPADTVVLFFPLLEDSSGKAYIATNTLSLISAASSVPVYSFWDVLLGHGMVGGYVNNFPAQSKTTAELALRVLRGTPTEGLPPTQREHLGPMFDWQQLSRWNIPESHLPEESIVINRNYTVWDEYWKQITAVLFLIGLQTLTIFYLMHLRRKHIKAEQELSSQRAEAEQLQGELAHLGRIGTINTLTSALAHEINQPLAAIRSYAQAALRFMDADDPGQENVKIALQGIVSDNKRAADVVNRLRDLVKKAEPTRDDFDLHATIHNVISLLNSEIVIRGVDISLDLCLDKSVIHADPVYIQQVLLNLVVNALDAVQNKPAGTRTIRVSTKRAPEELIISVADSGDGISEDDADQLFEPFYTTKSEGLGLGLAICKSLIESHRGKIWYKYEDDGAVFSFSLPTGENKQVT